MNMTDPWFRRSPQWYPETYGQGGYGDSLPTQATPGPSVGMQAPNYSQPRPAQAGEGEYNLPHTWEGSDGDKAAANRKAVKDGKIAGSDKRRDPYLIIQSPLTIAGNISSIALGKPNSGYRWVIRSLSIAPSTTIVDVTGGGASAHFFIGAWQGPTVNPALTNWAWTLTPPATAAPLLAQTFTSDILEVLGNQNLIAQISGGAPGYTYILTARVIQISDARDHVTEVV